MSKWYREGYQDALQGLPCDAPYYPGNPLYVKYMEGFIDGKNERDRIESDDCVELDSEM